MGLEHRSLVMLGLSLKMFKKAESLSLSTVIIFIIVLVVLTVLLIFIFGTSTPLVGTIKQQANVSAELARAIPKTP